MMNQLLSVLVITCVLIFGLAYLNQSRSEAIRAEAQAEAIIIRAEGQARLDSAQATAVTLAAALPLVLGVGVSGGLLLAGIGVLVFALRWQGGSAPAPRIIERQVLILGPGASRRDAWRMMTGEKVNLLRSNNDY
jgi:hypothetical protein